MSGSKLGPNSVTEDAVTGWELERISCVGDPDWTTSGRSAKLDLDPGERIRCTFVNARERGGTEREEEEEDPGEPPSDPGRSGGTLPFTGLLLGGLVLTGLCLLVAGRLLRRLSR
jgi:hypothetical protein